MRLWPRWGWKEGGDWCAVCICPPGGNSGGPRSPLRAEVAGRPWSVQERQVMSKILTGPLLTGSQRLLPSPAQISLSCLETTAIFKVDTSCHLPQPSSKLGQLVFYPALSFTITWLYRNMSGRTTFLRERFFFGRFFSSSGQRGAQELKKINKFSSSVVVGTWHSHYCASSLEILVPGNKIPTSMQRSKINVKIQCSQPSISVSSAIQLTTDGWQYSGKIFLGSSKKQNLYLPQRGNHLNSLYIVLGIITSNQEMT